MLTFGPSQFLHKERELYGTWNRCAILIKAKAMHAISHSTLNVIFHELTVSSPLAAPGFPSTRFPDLQEEHV